MPKVSASLSQDCIDELQFIALKQDQSLSRTLKSIIELGLKYHKYHRDHLPPMKQEEYLLRLINLTTGSFKMLYEQGGFLDRKGESADAALEDMTEMVKTLITKKYDQK
ncbi:MAG: hypothetical protein GY821_01535 [Gammaproteobacteria bacterium]|nr:hypothetical protein [Gammaproteobacteria bacterium]